MISDSKERSTVLEMFSCQFNADLWILDGFGTRPSKECIHRKCAGMMYEWYKERDFFKIWAYLYVNWYKLGQWKLWARSANPDEIPVLKTTMIVDSHWRRVKHNFLNKFNRSRIDLLILALTPQSIPQGIIR